MKVTFALMLLENRHEHFECSSKDPQTGDAPVKSFSYSPVNLLIIKVHHQELSTPH